MLHSDLQNLNKIPFHMPGHKRNPKFNIIGSEEDITEIEGFDNLHYATGSIKEIEDCLSEFYSSKRSFLLVNGSTVGLLSAIFAVTDDGDKIIIARNCHKSVYSACLLRHLNVIYAEPDYDELHGIYTRMTQEEIDRLTKQHPDAKAIVVTTPTYEGITSNITANIPIIADGAHAAHFPFGSFPKYPAADIVISSLHKTLPALTQTAVANIYNDAFTNKFKFYVDIFETSSPSYILMASASKCCEYLKCSKEDFNNYSKMLDDFYNKTKLNHLSFLTADDKSRICVSTAKSNINAAQLCKILRNKHKIEPEAAYIEHIVLISTVADDENALNALSKALTETDNAVSSKMPKMLQKPPCGDEIHRFELPEKYEATQIETCEGKTGAEFIFAYPPDIPLLTPNEIITPELLSIISEFRESGTELVSDSGLLISNCILTKAEL